MSLGARLNRRVAIQVLQSGQDETGQPAQSWVNVIEEGDGKCWAEVKDVSGQEFITADATQATVTTRITIRYRPGVLAAMRVVHGADVYKIAAVLGQDARSLLLMCSRGVT